ncbi:AsmA family protein [Telmatobacter bradus]|uniref:AsmA family protein n=1 Tax=Telmatobacter bradus TaxID=474953 RepID=UPI003B42FF10
MADEAQGRQEKRKHLWLGLGAVAVVLLALFVPPLISLNHYQGKVTELMSASLGRPVHLSSVSGRLLPRPAFELSNLTVEEDPAYGVEPVMHASSVTASIRLWALWRGKLEISSISVDEASLNLVRTPDGHWNMDSLFGRAAQKGVLQPGTDGQSARAPMPTLKATSSRINFKDGEEKLPFSLVDTDVTFWQEHAGTWRIQLKGHPARTDMSMSSGDTGVLEVSGSLQAAREMRQMPLNLDVDWREAQLGQLTRLAVGKDPGWRGDLRGQLHVEGTADALTVKSRLRAIGVHRQEFAPASPLDFDANCSFVYRFSVHTLENLECNSPLGTGKLRLAGDLPADGSAKLTLELDKIPATAGLDALRTVRSGFGAGLEASGSITGRLDYVRTVDQPAPLTPTKHAAKNKAVDPGPLTGELTIENFRLSGEGLSQPLDAAKIELHPEVSSLSGRVSLAGTASFPLGGSTPVALGFCFGLRGYAVQLHGSMAVQRSRELAHAAGFNTALLDNLAGDPLIVDLAAQGPWMAPETGSLAPAATTNPATNPAPVADSVSGTVALHNANWKASYLVNHLQIAQATLHIEPAGLRWDPVSFAYGPLKGTATLLLPTCAPDQSCKPQLTAQFGALDAITTQAALLGAQSPKGNVLNELIERLHPAQAFPWPALDAVVKVDSLSLGPVALKKATATLTVNGDGVEVKSLETDLLGGHAHLTGALKAGDKPGDKPTYTVSGLIEKLSPAAVGQLIGERWTGGDLAVSGKLETVGFTGDDLASSAHGTLHLDWKRGAVSGSGAPVTLAHFAHWTADAAISGGKLTLQPNEAVNGTQKSSVNGSVTLSIPAKASFAQTAPAKH